MDSLLRAPLRSRSYRKASLAALSLVALVGLLQCFLLVSIARSQRDAAHILDISGAQRMRTERIAYFLSNAALGHELPYWKERTAEAMANMQLVRAELRLRPELATGPVGADGKTDLGRRGEAYLADAAVLLQHPHDAATLEDLLAREEPLLAAYDNAVHLRAATFTNRQDIVVFAILAGLVLQIAAVLLGYRFALVPAQRQIDETFADLEDQQRQMQSVFQESPDPASIYDLRGRLVRTNATRERLLGFSEAEIQGHEFWSFVSGRPVEEARAAFERAAAGEVVDFETRFAALDGRLLDFKMSMFPYLVEGRRQGVVVMSKDVSELRRMEVIEARHTRRMSALYAIASKTGLSLRQQLDQTLEMARKELGYTWSGVFEARDEFVVPFTLQGEGTESFANRALPKEGSLSSRIMAAGDVLPIDDVDSSPWAAELNARGLNMWKAFAGIAVRVGGTPFGTFVLGSRIKRREPLTNSDVQFIRLVSSLISSTIERIIAERKLDSLAFFDVLTGLPNRFLLNEKIEELLAAARRHEGVAFAVHFVDLDHFKAVNDTAGHAAGDEVLRLAASRLENAAGAGCTVARLSGDEFVVLQPLAGGIGPAQACSKRIVTAIDRPFTIDNVAHRVGASVGVAMFPEDGRDARTLLERADQALYAAKRAGRNRSAFATSA